MIETLMADEVFWLRETDESGDESWIVYRYFKEVPPMFDDVCPLDRTCVEWYTPFVSDPIRVLPLNWWLV